MTLQIQRALRCRSAASANLTRTFGTPTTQSTYTFSTWVKRSKLGVLQNIFGVSTNHSLGFPAADTLVLTLAGTAQATSTALFRDPAKWIHIVYQQSGSTITLSVDNVTVATGSATSAAFNTAVAHTMAAANASNYFDGYQAQTYFVDGQALAPSNFGTVDGTTGAWVPIAYAGTFGNNGFFVDFHDNSNTTAATLGADQSGNANNWTPNNFSITAGASNDSLTDTPTNYGTDTGVGGEVRGNYCTLSSLDKAASISLSNGNLTALAAAPTWNNARAGFGVTTGKWYYEATISNQQNEMIGWANSSAVLTNDYSAPAGMWTQYAPGGTKYASGSVGVAYGATLANGDVVGVALDMGAGTLTFYKNGASQGQAFSGLVGPLFPWVGVNTASAQLDLNFGQRPFANTAPAGYQALCTSNLADPAILKPKSYMDVNLRTGTGAAFNVTGKAFQPDLVWSKSRSAAKSHMLADSTRGVGKYTSSDTAAVDVTDAQALTAFNSDGFSGGTAAIFNTNTESLVDWMWKKGATPGFDIVGYTGNGANRTVAHALGVVPEMMIVKNKASVNGCLIYHKSIGNTQYLVLSQTVAAATLATAWNSTTPTSAVFSLGTEASVNNNGDAISNYLFASIPGFSQIGTYTGNGSTDGPFVWCGFKPKLVLVKRTDSTSDWYVWDTARDTFNVMAATLLADTSGAETSATSIDALSNGFKARSATVVNVNTGTYIFAAFADIPFKFSASPYAGANSAFYGFNMPMMGM